jgi:hypothetical protein
MLDRSSSDRHIVRIYNDRQDHLINTVLALPAYRVRPTGNTTFTFWETPPNSARALRDWYWPGDNFGQEFPYPKHLREVAAAAPPAPPLEQPAPPAPAPPQVAEQPKEQPQEQPEIAEAAPPPPPPAPSEEPAPAPAPQQPEAPPPPQELPKTATPYPLIGLFGLLSLGIYGLLRARRWARA